MKINMIGGGFQHEWCSSGFNENTHVKWVKDGSANISIHIDWAILEDIGNKSKKKYAWLAESSAIIDKLIEKVKSNIDMVNDEYELIFTHDKRLLDLSPKMRFVIPNARPWIQEKSIFKKNKLVSMIASTKNMCPGHRYRLSWLVKLGGTNVDIFGSGHNYIPTKDMGLRDYHFSFAMENDNYPSIFCEKITDCFATGTIPIYWGTPDIGEFFNSDGIITLTDDFDLNTLNTDLYHSKLEAVLENYEKAIQLPTAEDYIYLNYLK